MKVLYVCNKCGELHRVEALSLVIIKPDMGVEIVDKESVEDRLWDLLAEQLPSMVRHLHKDQQ